MIAFAYNGDLSEAMYVVEDFLIYIPLSLLLVKSLAEKELIGPSPTAKVFGKFDFLFFLQNSTFFQLHLILNFNHYRY